MAETITENDLLELMGLGDSNSNNPKNKQVTENDLLQLMGLERKPSVQDTSVLPNLELTDREAAIADAKSQMPVEENSEGVDASIPELAARGAVRGVEQVGENLQGLVRTAITDITGYDVISDFSKMNADKAENWEDYISKMTEFEQKAFNLGNLAGETGAYVGALPARAPMAVIGGAGLIGASQPTTDNSLVSKERTMNMLIAANFGMMPQALLNTGKFLVGKVKSTAGKVVDSVTRSGGKKAAVEGVAPNSVEEAVSSAKRLGVNITPSEASANQVILSREAQAMSGLNEASSLQAQAIKSNRDAELSGVIKTFIDDILPQGRTATKLQLSELYNQAFKTRMSEPFLKNLSKSPIYAAAEKSLKNDPAKLKAYEALPAGSLGRVELVRREVSSNAYSSSISMESTERQKAHALRNVNTAIKEVLTRSSVDYKKALPIAQKQIAQKRIMDELSKINTKGSPSGTSVYNATPSQFYDQILSTPAKRKELKRQLKEVGGSVQVIDDLSFILARIKKTPFNALKADVTQSTGIATGGFGTQGAAGFALISFLKGRHNQALVDIITDGKWANSLTKVREIKDPVKQTEALSAALTYITASTLSKPSEEE